MAKRKSEIKEETAGEQTETQSLKILDDLSIPSPVALLGQLSRLASKLKPDYRVNLKTIKVPVEQTSEDGTKKDKSLKNVRLASVITHFGNLKMSITDVKLSEIHEEKLKHVAADLILEELYNEKEIIHKIQDYTKGIKKDYAKNIKIETDESWYESKKLDFKEKTQARVERIIEDIKNKKDENYSDEVRNLKIAKVESWKVCREDTLPYADIHEMFRTGYFNYLKVACDKTDLDFKVDIKKESKKGSGKFKKIDPTLPDLNELKNETSNFRTTISIFKKSDKDDVLLETSATMESNSLKKVKSKVAYQALCELINKQILKDVSRRTFTIKAEHVQKKALIKQKRNKGKNSKGKQGKKN